MPINFVPRERSAFDEGSGISIARPRMLPVALPDGTEGIEYQYAFVNDGERVGGTGFFGHERGADDAGRRQWVYTLDLSPEFVLEDILRFKRAIGNVDDESSFVRSLAQGLVNAFAGQKNNTDDLRYVAFTRVDSLARFGIAEPDGIVAMGDGRIVLADVSVLANRG